MIVKNQARKELVIGLFVIVAVAIVMYLIVSMGGKLFVSEYAVTAHFADAAGLSAGVTVTLAGVPVGEAASLKLLSADETRRLGRQGTLVRVVLSIERRVDIPVDSALVLDRTALLGEQSLRFTPSNNPEHLPKDGTAVVAKAELSPSPTEEVSRIAGKLQADIGTLIGNINSILGDAVFQRDVKDTAANVSKLTHDMRSVADSLDKAAASIDDTAAAARQVLAGDKLQQILKNADGLVSNLEQSLSAERISRTIDSLGGSARELEKFASQLRTSIEKEEGLLGVMARNKDFAGDVQSALKELKGTMIELQLAVPQFSAAMQQVRQLTELLSRYPTALLFGRPGSEGLPYLPPPPGAQ